MIWLFVFHVVGSFFLLRGYLSWRRVRRQRLLLESSRRLPLWIGHYDMTKRASVSQMKNVVLLSLGGYYVRLLPVEFLPLLFWLKEQGFVKVSDSYGKIEVVSSVAMNSLLETLELSIRQEELLSSEDEFSALH